MFAQTQVIFVGTVVIAVNEVRVVAIRLNKLFVARQNVVFPLINDFRALVASCFLIAVDTSIELGGVVYIYKNTEVEL